MKEEIAQRLLEVANKRDLGFAAVGLNVVLFFTGRSLSYAFGPWDYACAAAIGAIGVTLLLDWLTLRRRLVREAKGLLHRLQDAGLLQQLEEALKLLDSGAMRLHEFEKVRSHVLNEHFRSRGQLPDPSKPSPPPAVLPPSGVSN